MGFTVIIGLDQELPLMVWADIAVLYPHAYVLTPKGRMVRATENKIQYLISRAILDVRQNLAASAKTRDYLVFRALVARRLCERYGFMAVQSTLRTIVVENVQDVLQHATPSV